jgi:hypothetical protein
VCEYFYFVQRWRTPVNETVDGMFRCLVLVRTDVSEELSASFIRVTRIGELGTTLASVVPSSPYFFAACVGC